ncbi:zinc finger protein Xfin-like [Calliphora vicina]|uniref:zinc finger protein Xfin-like n=1 Tax=Calliphora vicina TaxID=7373 RepID=UPI00325B4D21
MSVEIIQNFSYPPLKKRPREIISLASDGASSKCAEIFVTNNADKWTFFCAYCQKATCDIGAFICHIRLEHLNVQTDSSSSNQTTELETNSCSLPNDNNLILPMTTKHNAVANDGEQPMYRNLIKKEVAIDSLKQPESNEMENFLANKNSTATPNLSNEILEQFYEINEFEDVNESMTNNDFDDVNESNTLSCYSLSDDDTYLESNDTNTASCSKPHKRRKKITDAADSELLHHKCPTCNRGFKTKQGAIQHILHSHDENYHMKLPIKCRVCSRGFHTASGLKAHIKSHDEKKHLQCPICPSKHKETNFITHVLTHECDTCFPCQVCGKVYNSNVERMQHWETHAKDKPFDCKICYRRYRKQQYLTRHLKIHNQYQCNFCPAEYVSTKTERAPYMCTSCENVPDIKQKAEHLRSLAYKNHVFDSDEDTLPSYNPTSEVAAQDNKKSNDIKQILLFSNNNDATRDESCNDSTTPGPFSLNEQIYNDNNDELLSIEDGSDLEFLNETDHIVIEDGDDDDDMPSSSGQHIFQSDSDTPQKCSYCDRVFKSRQALAPHLKCHINNDHADFPYKCSYCNRGFKTKSSLTFHHKTHDKNKYQLRCPICPFSGFREGDFINHVLTHETESCFPCQVCAKILPTNAERATHWKTHLKEKPHGCKYCYRRFSLKHILHRHIKTHIEYTDLNMSLDILQPFSAPSLKKRARETITLPSEEAFKCAEIFVTNNADKWTFNCDYCQKATSDIGVFICHIRLEHLNAERDLIVSKQTTELPDNVSTDLATNTQQQPVQCEIVKEEVTIATNHENLQLQNICEKDADIADISLSIQNSIPKSQHHTAGDNEVIFTITSIDSQLPQPQSISEEENSEISQDLYVINEETEKKYFDGDTSTHEISKEDNNEMAEINDSESCYSSNEDDGNDTDFEINDDNDTDFEINDDNEASGSSKKKIMKRSKTTFNCPYCPVIFKRKQCYARHILHTHDKKFTKRCDKCSRAFLTDYGLKVHLKSHDDKNHFECPVCKTKHIENYFITHVLTHESTSCFPCQVCGKIYASQKERMSHWKTHSKEKPFACSVCYRRYGKPHYLKRHLRSHYQYHCNLCTAEFYAIEAQRPPYVCRKCKKLPDIKQRVEFFKSLSDGNSVFVSDKDISKTSNPAEESINQNTAGIEGLPLNDNDNNDKLANDNDNDEENLSIEDFSDLEDDLPTMSQTPLPHKCKYCKRDFNSKGGLGRHIRKSHINNNQFSYPFKCRQCQRAFLSKSALNHHTKFHYKNFQFKCPLCPITKPGEAAFVAHVMLHETDSCCPCQVCGEIFTSNKERMAHWKTHVEEKPHACLICYRRFAQKFVLKRHLKIHNRYDCVFCTEHFNSPNSLKQPYICGKCEKLPDIKDKIEHLRSSMS